MKVFGRGEHRRLEARLRAERPQPADELVHRLSARVRHERRGGSTVGQGVDGPQTKVIRYQMLVPRAIPLQLRIPVNLMRPGQLYRIVVYARDPQGNRSSITIPFRLQG